MQRLGYNRYVAQGGDWGSVVADKMAEQKIAGLIGIHVNMPATVPPEVATALTAGLPAPANLTADKKVAYNQMNDLYTRGGGYAGIMVTRPQTLGYSLADSPAGLAAFFYDKIADWTFSGGEARAGSGDRGADDHDRQRLRRRARRWCRVREEVQRALRNRTLPGIGHNVPQEAPRAFADAILDADRL